MLSGLVDPVGSRPLGVTRIVIGVAAGIRSLVALPVLLRLAEPGVIQAPVLTWMPAPSREMAFVLVGVWLTSAIMLAVGWRVPASGPVLLACLIFMLVLDLQTYSNHLYLMAWLVLLLIVADAGSGLSLGRRSSPVPYWPIGLIMIQVSVVYGFSAITKLNDEFLTGRVLAGVLRGGVISFPETLRAPRFLGAVAVAAVMVEAFIALALWSRRFRTVAFILGFGLHASITLLMADTLELLVFSLLMMSTYPLFARVRTDRRSEPGWSHRGVDGLATPQPPA